MLLMLLLLLLQHADFAAFQSSVFKVRGGMQVQDLPLANPYNLASWISLKQIGSEWVTIWKTIL